MKNTKRYALSFFFLTLALAGSAQVSSPDSAVQKLFAALKAKDEKAYVALFPNGQQMARLMRSMMETMFKSEEMQKMIAADPKSKDLNLDSLIDAQLAEVTKPEAQAEMEKNFAKKFQEIVEKGEKRGVNWSAAELTTYTLDTTAKLEDAEMQQFGGTGMKNLKGVIDFTAGGTAYQMNLEKLIYLPSEKGWFGGEFKQVIKKGEKFSVADETEEVAAPTKPAAKAKPKTTGAKTKTKAKTPVSKTKAKTKA